MPCPAGAAYRFAVTALVSGTALATGIMLATTASPAGAVSTLTVNRAVPPEADRMALGLVRFGSFFCHPAFELGE